VGYAQRKQQDRGEPLSRAFPYHKVHVHRLGVKAASRLYPRQRLALFAVILLNGMCLSLLGWCVYARLAKARENAGNLLQIAFSSPKLKETSAEPVSLEMPAAITTQEPVERTSEAPPAMSVPEAPPKVEPPALAEVESIPLAVAEEPILVYSSNHAHHQGDSPMMRNWKSLELAALLAAAFTAQPVLFAGEKEPDLKAVVKRLDKMDDNLAKLFEKISNNQKFFGEDLLKTKIDVDKVFAKAATLEDKLDKLHFDLEKLKKQLPSEFRLDEIKAKLGQIERDIANLQTKSRVSLSPSVNTGRVMLVNLYPEELLFVVNGRNYRVPPNRHMPLENHPAGALTYEVIAQGYGMIVRKTSSLDPNETFTITAR
jgi:cytochrome c556